MNLLLLVSILSVALAAKLARRDGVSSDNSVCLWRYKIYDEVNGKTYCAIPHAERDEPLQVIECEPTDTVFPFCIGIEANWLRTGAQGGWCASFKNDVIYMVRCNTDGNYPAWQRSKNYGWHSPKFVVEDNFRTKDGICPYADLDSEVWKIKKCPDS